PDQTSLLPEFGRMFVFTIHIFTNIQTYGSAGAGRNVVIGRFSGEIYNGNTRKKVPIIMLYCKEIPFETPQNECLNPF
ncbi:MAG: hypothetical protein WD139_04730, partial [Balneolaceae bacterium]